MIPSRKSKAVGLFSAGLDSILATKLVAEQGVSVVALHFRLPFAAPGRADTEERLSKLAEMAGASLVAIDAGDDYLEMVRNPKYGYTKQMAPCVDCIVYMLNQAKQLAREIKADFVFTGEVVGQRAVCQNKRSLKTIENVTGLEGRLLRPLSAKLLEPTIPELTGLVRRERLLDIRGRSRRRQMRLAHEFGIFDYPIPGTGCMLLDKSFAARARDAVACGQLRPSDIDVLRHGRHFRLESGAKVVVGRNEEENKQLEMLVTPDDVVCRFTDVMGPVVVLRSEKKTKKDTEIAARIGARYSDVPAGRAVNVVCGDREFSVKPYADEDIQSLRIQAVESNPQEKKVDAPQAEAK